MNDWKSKFSPASLAAVVLLVVIAAYDLFAPPPALQSKGKQEPVSKLKREASELRTQLQAAKVEIGKKTWTGAEDEIAPKAMAAVSAQARKHFVNVSAFRPQRVVNVDGVSHLNYLVAVEGGFPEIVAFLKSFETPESKIAVKAVQMTSADGATDAVRVSVSLVAYRVEGSHGN